MKYKSYYIGCSDPFGNNNPDSLLNKTIADVCLKYNMKAKDFDIIARAFKDACHIAFNNGGDSATFED